MLTGFFAATLLASATPESPVTASAYIFWSTDCPVARRYLPRLQQFCQEFSADPSCKLELYFPNSYEDQNGIAKFTADAKLSLAPQLDVNGSLIRQFQVEVVPSIVVLNQNHRPIYRGPLDDNEDPALVHHRLAWEAMLAAKSGRLPTTTLFPPVGCTVSRAPRKTLIPTVSYVASIAPLIKMKCLPCHGPGRGAPNRLDSYLDVHRWKTMIARRVGAGTMPPIGVVPGQSHFAETFRMTVDQRELLLKWINNGLDFDSVKTPHHAALAMPPHESKTNDDLAAPITLTAIHGDSSQQYFRGTYRPNILQASWFNAFNLKLPNLTDVRDVTIYRLPAPGQIDASPGDSAQWLGTWSMGQSGLAFPASIGVKLAPGDELAVVVHRVSVATDRQLQGTLELRSINSPNGELRSIRLEPRAFQIPAEGTREFYLERNTVYPVQWIGFRTSTKLLGGIARVSLDNRLLGSYQVLSQWWRPEYRPDSKWLGSKLSFRIMLENRTMSLITPFLPPKAIQSGKYDNDESLWCDATYVQPITPLEGWAVGAGE